MKLVFKSEFNLNLDYFNIKEEDVISIVFKEGCLYLETKQGYKICDINDELQISDLELED